MRRVSYIGALRRKLLLVGMALAVLIPQTYAACPQNCEEMGCTCHEEKPVCCEVPDEKPASPVDCECDNCGAIQLPDKFCPIAKTLQFKRCSQTETPERQITSNFLDNQSLKIRHIAPLDLENRFISQIDDLISATVIIS